MHFLGSRCPQTPARALLTSSGGPVLVLVVGHLAGNHTHLSAEGWGGRGVLRGCQVPGHRLGANSCYRPHLLFGLVQPPQSSPEALQGVEGPGIGPAQFPFWVGSRLSSHLGAPASIPQSHYPSPTRMPHLGGPHPREKGFTWPRSKPPSRVSGNSPLPHIERIFFFGLSQRDLV